MMKKLIPRLILLATATLIAASANAQTSEQNVNVTIRPSQTVEQRVADEIKARELKKAAEEKLAAEEAAKIAETSPQALLRRARVVYIGSNTDFFEAVQLQNSLRKHQEFDAWQMAIVDGRVEIADVVITIDRPLFTYTFTYKITSRNNGIVLATGKVTAFDGNDAAPKLAQRIIEEIKVARGMEKLSDGVTHKPVFLIRNLLRVVDLIMLFFPLSFVIFSPLRQRVGDMAAGTIVVSVRFAVTVRRTEVFVPRASAKVSLARFVWTGVQLVPAGP